VLEPSGKAVFVSKPGDEIGNTMRDEPMKYLYLDIVAFSRNRPTEAQADIIQALNDLVIKALSTHLIAPEKALFLPTGDGMCIALKEASNAYDIHLRIAITILQLVEHRNKVMEEGDHRRFDVRIGVNEETDILYTDINSRMNVAGQGINLAQRIMDAGDKGHILVGSKVFETVANRERYRREDFRSFPAIIKHGREITIYQFIQQGHEGLNLEIPTSEVRRQELEKNLREIADLKQEAEVMRRENQEHEKRRTQYFRGVDTVFTILFFSIVLLVVYGLGASFFGWWPR
jgi:class 3 adenylate cyclase